jgi:hypothetical protein
MRTAKIGLLLACPSLLLLAGCATQPRPGEAEALPARVFRVQGNVQWRSAADQPWQEVKTGTRLAPGSEIQTAAKSRAEISFGRSPKRIRGDWGDLSIGVSHHHRFGHTTLYENMICIWESSLLRFDRLALVATENVRRPAEALRIELSAGHIFGMAPKLAEGSRYEVKFLAGVANVFGTIYDVSAEGLIRVRIGNISVTYPGSQTPQIVAGEQQFDVRTGVLYPLQQCD